MHGGIEWLVDAEGCRADALSDLALLQSICDQLIDELQLRVLGQPQWHAFPDPGGVTGLFLLTESHLSCHTFPESGLASFNLYSCRPKPRWDWELELQRQLGADSVLVRELSRGDVARGDVARGDVARGDVARDDKTQRGAVAGSRLPTGDETRRESRLGGRP